MQNFKLKKEDKEYLIASLNRVIGVIQSVKNDIEDDHACEESVNKVMASKGALARVGKEMISRGVLNCLSRYSNQDLEKAIKLIFKMD